MKKISPKPSIIVRLNIALASIMILGISTMLVSYWLSEHAEQDPLAINIASSLRMQTYRIGLMAMDKEVSTEAWQAANQKINRSWISPVFTPFLRENPDIKQPYDLAKQHWQEKLQPFFVKVHGRTQESSYSEITLLLDEHKILLDQFVNAIQLDAEKKVRNFRLVQITALFATLLVSSIIIYSLKVKVEQPLNRLTNLAKRISHGDFKQTVHWSSQDELGVLANTFNVMCKSISQSHESLEQQVEEKTHALQQSNNSLQFLYETAKFIIEHNPQGIDYDEIIARLSHTINVENIELCLMTATGNSPYLQIIPNNTSNEDHCNTNNCTNCMSSRGIIETIGDQAIYHFQLIHLEKHYGLIVCRVPNTQRLSAWQEQLIQSTTDQLAIGLSLKTEEDQSRRLAVLQERNAIARELHDSLAQALSYLKIQVTRLNKAIDVDDKNVMENIAEELREGLSNAYRQLRELLTTFRLKIDGNGLQAALEYSVEQLRSQTDMNIDCTFALANVPLTPNEEIHLLQIIREASQNAIHHSSGKNLSIRLWQTSDKTIHLTIVDDGKGLPVSPEKINHYGLAIMKERARHLQGELILANRESGGLSVNFEFLPEFMMNRIRNGIIASDIDSIES